VQQKNGVAAKKQIFVHFLSLKSILFRIEGQFLLREKFSKESFQLLITGYVEVICLLLKAILISRTQEWLPSGMAWIGSPRLCVRVLLTQLSWEQQKSLRMTLCAKEGHQDEEEGSGGMVGLPNQPPTSTIRRTKCSQVFECLRRGDMVVTSTRGLGSLFL